MLGHSVLDLKSARLVCVCLFSVVCWGQLICMHSSVQSRVELVHSSLLDTTALPPTPCLPCSQPLAIVVVGNDIVDSRVVRVSSSSVVSFRFRSP